LLFIAKNNDNKETNINFINNNTINGKIKRIIVIVLAITIILLILRVIAE